MKGIPSNDATDSIFSLFHRPSNQEYGLNKLAKQNDELLMRVHLADGTIRSERLAHRPTA